MIHTYITAAKARGRLMLHNIQTHSLLDFSERRAVHLGDALSVGTMLPIRFFLALFSIVMGAQILGGQPSMFSHVGMQTFFQVLPASWWGGAMFFCGSVMLWRVAIAGARPIVAWANNIAVFALWLTIVIVRLVLVGGWSWVNTSTVVAGMAFLVLMRTEATERDRETA